MRRYNGILIMLLTVLLSGCGTVHETASTVMRVEKVEVGQTAGESGNQEGAEAAEDTRDDGLPEGAQEETSGGAETNAGEESGEAGDETALPDDVTASDVTVSGDELTQDDVTEVRTVTLRAVGDDLIHSGFYNYAQAAGCDYSFMFENVSDVISEADIAIINQETIFVSDPSQYSDYPLFGSPTGIGDALIEAGFDVVQLATNHCLDKGLTGISDTVDYFSDKDVLAIGVYTDEESASEIPFMEKNGITFAFLNYTYGTNGLSLPNSYCVNTFSDEEKVRDDIRRARELADIVVVLPHWGTEYTYRPDSFQEKWTEIFLEEGVDIVIGTHPHVVQPYEMLTGEDGHQMLVYYSLGNFISYQDEMERMLGGMADITVTISDEGVSYEYDLVPLVTYIHSGVGTTTYFLSAYDKTDHKYGATKENMAELFEKIINWEA
ncbi:MAG: CapA family protein [Lachnospiraceae bacterium]|nr:CapA family protein [Lachnospiraceae bacterium]